MEHFAYNIVDQFAQPDKRVPLNDTLRETMWRTCLGQLIDGKYCYNANKSSSDSSLSAKIATMSSLLTTEHFEQICTSKTSYYTIVYPVKIGIILGGAKLKEEVEKLVEEICILIGIIFQAKVYFIYYLFIIYYLY